MAKIKTSTGMILDTDHGMSKQLTEYCATKNIKQGQVFYVEQNNTYLLVVNGEPEFESQSSEEIAVHIDMISISESTP